MAIDFPASPAVGAVFTSGGVAWLWNGLTWTTSGAMSGPFLPLAGGTLTGALTLAADPTAAFQATTKQYTDNALAPYAPLASPTFTGTPVFPVNGFRFGGSNLIGFAWDSAHLTCTIDGTGTPGRIQAMRGVVDGSNPAAGDIGEYRSVLVASASAVALTNGTWTQIASLSLAAGDWDLSGAVGQNVTSGSPVIGAIGGGVGTAVTPVNAVDYSSLYYLQPNSPNAIYGLVPCGVARITITAATTVYLSGLASWTATGAVGGYGILRARRVR